MKRFSSVAALVVTFVLASTASATTLYVAPTGADGAVGSLTAPLKTIARAAALARAGDTVLVRAGVYAGPLSISSKGTAAAPIAFKAYPGEHPVIDGSATAINSDLVTLYTAQYVEVSGFEIRYAKRIGVSSWLSSHIKINSNEIHHSQTNAIYAGSDTFGQISDITIDGNVVHDNVQSNQYHAMPNGGWAQAVAVQFADGANITNNKVYDNDGEGIDFIQSKNGYAHGNTVYDNFSVGMYLDNTQTTVVDGNYIYSTGNSRYYRDSHPATGIGVANETGTVNAANALTITNNIVVRTRWGLFYSNDAGGGIKNSTIANNTFYLATQTMLWISSDANSGNTVADNIFDQVGAPMTDVVATGFTFHNNLWYGGTAGTAAGSGDLIADPKLSNAGGPAATDYRLTQASPAVKAATTIATVKLDYFGATRVSPADIGAHAFSSSAAPLSPAPQAPTAPAIPTNLRVTGLAATAISMAWNAVTGATSYHVYRNGVLLATTTTAVYSNVGLPASTTYSYQVSALNAAGTESMKTAAVQGTTLAARRRAN